MSKKKQVANVENEPIKFRGGQVGSDGRVQLKFTAGEGWEKELKKIFGTDNRTTCSWFVSQIANIVDPHSKDIVNSMKGLTPIFRAIGPTDELEGMLAVQMISIHFMAMQMMGEAMHYNQTPDGVNQKVSQVSKLTRTFISQMDALNKHRGKGQQKMTVKHVHVNEGGQAVIGNVGRGEDENKK